MKILEEILSRPLREESDEDIILIGNFNSVSKLGNNEFLLSIKCIGIVWSNFGISIKKRQYHRLFSVRKWFFLKKEKVCAHFLLF